MYCGPESREEKTNCSPFIENHRNLGLILSIQSCQQYMPIVIPSAIRIRIRSQSLRPSAIRIPIRSSLLDLQWFDSDSVLLHRLSWT
jgi:hypothetical protein